MATVICEGEEHKFEAKSDFLAAVHALRWAKRQGFKTVGIIFGSYQGWECF